MTGVRQCIAGTIFPEDIQDEADRNCLLDGSLRFAQRAELHLPVTDAEKIADALRAGPTSITKDTALLDLQSMPKCECRVLRKGTNEWTCLSFPGIHTTNEHA